MKDPRDVILRPVVSEKSYGLLDSGVYTFEVAPSASKPEIRDAVQAMLAYESGGTRGKLLMRCESAEDWVAHSASDPASNQGGGARTTTSSTSTSNPAGAQPSHQAA